MALLTDVVVERGKGNCGYSIDMRSVSKRSLRDTIPVRVERAGALQDAIIGTAKLYIKDNEIHADIMEMDARYFDLNLYPAINGSGYVNPGGKKIKGFKIDCLCVGALPNEDPFIKPILIKAENAKP